MSTAIRRTIEQAVDDAHRLRAMFTPEHYQRWKFAGSVRRGRQAVGDVEHVVIPRFGTVTLPGDMYPTEGVNLLWHCLDEQVARGRIAKAVYQNNTNRWGDLYRGVELDGFKHELFTANADNFGAILAIRTGPAEFSQRLVTQMKNAGRFRQQNGHVIHQAGPSIGTIHPVPTERDFFAACGEPWREPHQRDGVARQLSRVSAVKGGEDA